jgi:hypothetical protein
MAVLHKINPVSLSALKTKSPSRCAKHHYKGITDKIFFSRNLLCGLLQLRYPHANIAKHSQASQVSLSLSANPQAVQVVFQDNGLGFDPGQNTTGFGLQSMQERTAALGGLFTLSSQPGAGCRIRVTHFQLSGQAMTLLGSLRSRFSLFSTACEKSGLRSIPLIMRLNLSLAFLSVKQGTTSG